MIKYYRLGLFLAGTAVILGAFGAHALKELLSPGALESFGTGVRYQLIHALVIVFLSVFFANSADKHLKRALFLFSIGVMLFSFSIYSLVLLKNFGFTWASVFGPITPIGGTLIIIAWFYLLIYSKSHWGNIVKKRDV